MLADAARFVAAIVSLSLSAKARSARELVLSDQGIHNRCDISERLILEAGMEIASVA